MLFVEIIFSVHRRIWLTIACRMYVGHLLAYFDSDRLFPIVTKLVSERARICIADLYLTP